MDVFQSPETLLPATLGIAIYAYSAPIRVIAIRSKVVDFKRKFYPRGWARYNLAFPGEIRLMSAEHSLKSLAADYAQMSEMIFGDSPQWEDILTGLRNLENVINDNKDFI